MHKAFYKMIAKYFMYVQTVSTRPLLGREGGGSRGAGVEGMPTSHFWPNFLHSDKVYVL